MKREPYDPEKLEHNDAPPLALSDWQANDDITGAFSTMIEGDITEPDPCPHCGVRDDPWWSRSEPMGYFCQHCGNNWDEPPTPISNELPQIPDALD